ncbi:MAG: ATP-dependent Clp protease ATP-binding subunit ClpC, partial [Oscillospiraceae bacterium]|nr:ATP-dependent Clp protease ATP-binding subunit ClpC [Oscillospiraceae bacterium]
MRYEDRFTERAKYALNLAHDAAAKMGHGYVGSEHILLGLIRENDGVAARTLKKAGLDEEMIAALVEKFVGRGEESSTTALGLTPRGKRIIELAVNDAARLGHRFVGTEHLLMGILRESDCVAAKVIASTGADLNRLYTDLINMFRGSEYRQPAVGQERTKHSDTKTLDQFSRDLTEAASKGELDPVIGREQEIRRVVQILSRRTKNNPALIGEPGVGKTAI